MSNQKDFIPAEEVCTRLNKELEANVFTFGKFMRLVKKGLITFHDVRTPGTKMIRYAFKYEEVKESLEKLKKTDNLDNSDAS
ncbi:hypothetical protein [Sulfurimonas sp.]|jgi:transcription initiation factor IIE alpha subunit|uniref:hypothetical protein n=1 Tax=Sulfurimonas sp. TaxID=2022749 RepID=UPI0025FDA5BC|nr:hypothetical protein [Sulfurimonas sp.]MCK9473983.1 hypothetical protein [Sulfurimonas sp.]